MTAFRSRTRWSALALGVTVTTVLVGALVLVARDNLGARRGEARDSGSLVPAGSGSLVLTNFTIKDTMDANSQVEATYDIDWKGTGFPGVRECSWTAYDSSGNEVGSKQDGVAALAPDTGIPIAFGVTGPAAAIKATCGPRLDVGTPYTYTLANTAANAANGGYDVTFDAQWAAAGQAGAVTCVFSVVDSSGTVLGSETTNLMILTGQIKGDVQHVPSTSTEASGLRAKIDCVPFSG